MAEAARKENQAEPRRRPPAKKLRRTEEQQELLREQLLELEIAGANIKQMSAETGLSRTRLWEIRTDPGYIAESQKRRAEMRAAHIAQCLSGPALALAEQRRLLRDPKTPPAVKRELINDMLGLGNIATRGPSMRLEVDTSPAPAQAPSVPDEFVGRTPDELLHYATTGRWPKAET